MEEIRTALKATFSIRKTHPLPKALAPPPRSWETDFTEMATEANLSTQDCLAAFSLLDRFWAENTLGDETL